MILRFFRDNTVINQIMGNAKLVTQSSTQRQTVETSQYADTGSVFSHFPIFSTSKGQSFIGREIDLPQNYGREIIMQNMRISKQAEAILPIQHFEFRAVSTVCSQQQKYLLLSTIPEQTLQDMYKSRKAQNKAFRASQINSIIGRIAVALQIPQQKHLNLQIDMESVVFLGDKAYIVNSLMYDSEKDSGQIFGRYRAPEAIDGRYDFQDDNSWLQSQLFALGVICLSLAFIQINIEALIYYKTDKANRKGVSKVQIQLLLERIKNVNLAGKLRCLLSFDPKNRGKVYELMRDQSKQTIQKDIVQRNAVSRNELRVGKQNRIIEPKMKENNVIPMKRQIVFRQNIIPVRSSKALQKSTIFLIQNVNNSLILNHDLRSQSRTELFAIKVTAPERIPITNYTQANKQNINLSSSRKSEPKLQIIQNSPCLDTITPQKQRKKKQFSTIKEVTQYDDHNSVSCHKSVDFLSGKFEGNLIDGKKQGFGVFYFQQGSRYEGEWWNDKMHGFGKLYYNGDKLAYQGHWNEGEFHGNGKVYNNEPLQLTQLYDYNDFGNLTEEWLSYEGQLQHDRRQGWGILSLSNGERFEGEFRNDMADGKGVFYTLNKGQIRGIWSRSKLVGKDAF